jgi:hypothetical protein
MSRPKDPTTFPGLRSRRGKRPGRARARSTAVISRSARSAASRTRRSPAGHIHWNVPALLEEMKAAMRDAAGQVPHGLAGSASTPGAWTSGSWAATAVSSGCPSAIATTGTSGPWRSISSSCRRKRPLRGDGRPVHALQHPLPDLRHGPRALARARRRGRPPLHARSLQLPAHRQEGGRGDDRLDLPDAGSPEQVWIPGLFQAMGLSKKAPPAGHRAGDHPRPAERPGHGRETGLSGVPVIATAAMIRRRPSPRSRRRARTGPTSARAPGRSSASRRARRSSRPRPWSFNFTNEGGVGGTTRFLKNVSGLWLVQGCRKAWEKDGPVSYEELARAADEAPPSRRSSIPTAPIFLNPPDMPEAIREFCRKTGQKPPTRRPRWSAPSWRAWPSSAVWSSTG